MINHIPVLLEPTMTMMNIHPDGIYLDLTIGRGGHARVILSQLKKGRLIGFDQDYQAIQALQPLLTEYKNLTIVHRSFLDLTLVLKDLGIDSVDGILLDLGVSSPQFDIAERGFSYRLNGPLDMRMNQNQSLTAAHIVQTYSLQALSKIFKEYGDETFAYPIAKAIVQQRITNPIVTTFDLVDIIKKTKPAKALKKKGHPAKQVFQALRIAVNDELEALKKVINQAVTLLKPLGRLAIITFHSGEDRIVKTMFKAFAVTEGTRVGPQSIEKNVNKPFVIVSPSPVKPTTEEIALNHRSESATLRVLERRAYAS
jgi:16S rRNA (cytosine1402-N4)-methyltransferase